MDCTKCMHGFPEDDSDNRNLVAIRALHQTVVSLRTALDKSKSELQKLKSKSITDVEADLFKGTIEKLSLENHILRQRVLITRKLVKNVENIQASKVQVGENKYFNYMDRPTSKPVIQTVGNPDKENIPKANDQSEKKDCSTPETKEAKNKEKSENASQEIEGNRPACLQKVNGEPEEVTLIEKVEDADKITTHIGLPVDESFEEEREADSESEELDDIELIFTTEDTKDLPTAQENLVSITDAESWNTVEGTPILLKYTEAQQFDEAPEDERTEEDDSKLGRSQVGKGSESEIDKTWQNSIPIETDISKCGIVEENDVPIASPQKSRRNTLPSPAHHRPIIHGETVGVISKGPLKPLRSYETRPGIIGVNTSELESGTARPILNEGHGSARRESGAQTDITALPSRWRSEGYLAHKVSHNFTTLPSKFTMPPSPLPSPTPQDTKKRFHSQSCRDRRSSTERHAHLRLNEESQEARRTLLSDINFTSMVPELSRSADHLCQNGEGIRGSGVIEASRCLLMGMDLGFGRKCNTLCNESSHLPCSKRGVDGYRWGCHEVGRRGRGTCTVRPTTWDCPMRGTNSSLGQGQTSWSSIPSTPNAQDVEWNPQSLRRNPWKVPAESPIWASSVPTSPTHFQQSGPQTHSSSCNYSHHCTRRQSGPPLYCSGGGSCTSGWGYDVAVGSSKAMCAVPYSTSTTSFSGALYSRKCNTAHQRPKNRVTFKDAMIWRPSARPGNSLPDLRDEYIGIRGPEEEEEGYGWNSSRGRGSGSGGDSTDSLIDEAEEYLRRSIDSILTGADWTRVGRRRQTRRHSDPDPVRELRPPQSAQPFLPKEPKDLLPECFVKVILSNGRVVVGRVRYSGILRGADKEEYIVGVELPCHSGDSDGTFRGIRYFDCNSNRAVFVPFKKVIIAWNT